MNAKRLRSILLSALALVLWAGAASAQPAGRYLRENPFPRSRHMCGNELVLLGTSLGGPHWKSSASVYGVLEQGDFRPGYSSSSIWRMGAEASTSGHFNDGKTFMTGSFSFEEMHGKDMMTSMFINPGYYPIDVLEFTPGDKKLQTYRFSGGIGQWVAPRWKVGGRVDFASQNYSKRKDIRHTNYALDLTVEPSVLWMAPHFQLGLSSVFRKTSESIEAEQVGAATADTYMAFFDKGLRYGTLQSWDGAGIHLAEAGVNRLPVREFSYGAGVQFSKRNTYLDAEYLRTSGSAGEKGYDWYRFPGHRITAKAVWNAMWSDLSYISSSLDVLFRWQGQSLEESVLDKVNTGGVTLPKVYGWNLVSRRRQMEIAPTLTLDFPNFHNDYRPLVRSLQVGYVGVIMDEQASPSYPYTDRWHVAMHRVHATAAFIPPYDGFWERIDVSFGARLLWASDHSQGLEASGQADDTVIPADPPVRLDSDWVRKREYMTASAAALSAQIRYNILFLPGLYVSADVDWLRAFRVEYLTGKNRLTATLRLGYEF